MIFECARYIDANDLLCKNSKCRYHISCEEDRNCAILSAETNGPQGLREIAAKMNLSYVRIFQIEKDAMSKIILDENDDFRELLNE